MNILFICTGNTCRSPMAEALFKNLAKNQPNWRIQSAGTSAWDGDTISPESLQELSHLDIDASSHRSQGITEDMVHEADHIYTLTESHRDMLLQYFPEYQEKIQLVTCMTTGKNVSDPIGCGQKAYHQVCLELIPALQAIYNKLATE